MPIPVLAAGSLVLVFFCSLTRADNSTTVAGVLNSPHVLVVAHRGDSFVAPENTLPAFRAAIQAKADLVELDYRHSPDNVPVVLHAEKLGRTTDAAKVLGRGGLAITDVRGAEPRPEDLTWPFRPGGKCHRGKERSFEIQHQQSEPHNVERRPIPIEQRALLHRQVFAQTNQARVCFGISRGVGISG